MREAKVHELPEPEKNSKKYGYSMVYTWDSRTWLIKKGAIQTPLLGQLRHEP
jgi:hypothetical protein